MRLRWIIDVSLVAVCGLAANCASRHKEPEARLDATALANGGTQPSEVARPGPTQPADRTATPARTPATTGDIEVVVQWPNVPAAWLAPGPMAGARRCGEPSPAAVKMDAAFGVRDVLVRVETPAAPTQAATTSPGVETRVALGPCDPGPPISVAKPGDLLLFNQGAARQVTLQASAWALPPRKRTVQTRGKVAADELVLIAMETPGVYYVSTTTSDVEAVLVVTNNPFLGVTDDHGTTWLRGLPRGEHRVVAWLPRRGSAAEQLVSSTVMVEVGKTARLVLTLGNP